MTSPVLRFSRPLVMDGAMGTRLIAAGHPVKTPLERLLVWQPEAVAAVHRSYVAAGAQVLVTGTFRGNRPALQYAGMDRDFVAIQKQGVEVARAAARSSKVLVLGSIGPVPVGYPAAAAVDAYREQAEVLMAAGADGILAETITDLPAIRALAAAMGPLHLPWFGIVVALGPQLLLRDGLAPSQVWRWMRELGVKAYGVNCGAGFAAAAAALESARPAAGEILIARPSAGLPVRHASGLRYPDSPESIAPHVTRLWARGVQWIGGCCGTTPDHIKAIVNQPPV